MKGHVSQNNPRPERMTALTEKCELNTNKTITFDTYCLTASQFSQVRTMNSI